MVTATDFKLPIAPDPLFVLQVDHWSLAYAFYDRDARGVEPQLREIPRRKFYEFLELAMGHEFVIPIEELLSWSNLRSGADSATIEGWLDANCPSHARVGLNIAFNNPDDLFAFKMRRC